MDLFDFWISGVRGKTESPTVIWLSLSKIVRDTTAAMRLMRKNFVANWAGKADENFASGIVKTVDWYFEQLRTVRRQDEKIRI